MTTTIAEGAIILLTLTEHKDGIWITQLYNELELLGENVQVVLLESILGFRSDRALSAAKLIVNRVSDAAEPHLYKACMGILLSSYPTKIWNGPISYAQCGNKWCHHELLERAGLQTPVTALVFPVTKERVQQACQHLLQNGHNFPFLLKPNAGGFGAGIMKITTEDEATTLLGPDPMLLQVYVPPAHDQLYRIWFLQGKVQCGVIRTNQQGMDEFTTGCAAKRECSLSDASNVQPIITPMHIPNDVVSEIQDCLLPLLPDANCGSVEYLQDDAGHRLYFDVNLLSTLPLIETLENPNEVWRNDYNPWNELASAIVDYCKSTR